MSRNSDYWEKRADERMELYQRNADKEINKLFKAYDKALYELEADIKKMYDKFQRNGKLDEIQAKAMLNKELSTYEINSLRQVLRNTKDEKLQRYLLARLNAPAYKARITRKEAIKESIYAKIKELGEYEREINTSLYVHNVDEAYYRHLYDIQKGVGLGFDVASINNETVQAILNNPWSGKTFSKRIWSNTDILADELYNVVVSGITSGKSFKHMTRELEETMGVSKHAAKRLVKTETTYFSNMAEIESYKECDIEKYIYMAILDKTTSKTCRELDGEVFEVSKAKPGENLPPMHPFCRSTTGAYFDDDDLSQLKRRARDPVTGATYVIPEYMTYEEWHKKYVIDTYGEDKINKIEKKHKNKSSDKKQFDKYKEVLGDKAPKSFDKFQKLKYNDTDKWNEIKSDYKYVNMLNDKKIIVKDNDHRALPPKGEANTITDLIEGGEVKQRRLYGEDGRVIKDIDASNHNRPKHHPMGAHKHVYDYEKQKPHSEAMYFTEEELRQNSDIIKDGGNYHGNKYN